jgi:hypothetical protein
MRTCRATVHENLTMACEKPATKCQRFLCERAEGLINLVPSCDEHAKSFEKCDGFLGYTEAKDCAYGQCGKPAHWELFIYRRVDDQEGGFTEEGSFSPVCEAHRKTLKANDGFASPTVGEKAILPPHRVAILQETGLQVLVEEDDTILGSQGDTMLAELVVGQHVVWVDDDTVRLEAI